MRIKKHDELRPKQRQQFSFITTFSSDTCTNLHTLKTKVVDVVGCVFEVECSVGGFLILK
jgi:hypothetical protein